MKTRSVFKKWIQLAMATAVAAGFGGAAQAARPLTTDRPDATESPFTVEPGRVQLEVSAAEWTRDRRTSAKDGVRTETWALAPLNVRVGLTADTELQIVHDGYVEETVKDRVAGTTDRRAGAGDLTLRYKLNLWGTADEGGGAGGTALGVMPYVKLPTASAELGNGNVEGGVIVPFATDLAGGWGFGAMTELAIVRNDADTGERAAWLNTATVSYEMSERAGVFGEVTLRVGEGKPAATFNTGATYAVNDDVQLDVGVNLGLTRAADDLTVFAGMTWRY